MLVDLESIGSEGGETYQRRVALVMGNSRYASVAPLKNPGNDAGAIAKLLSGLGFTVFLGTDLDTEAMGACVSAFEADLEREAADLSLFFYAGHGVQLQSASDGDKRNYMLATDARVDKAGKGVGFSQIDSVLSDMRRRSEQAVFFYDACRNDPFGEQAPISVGGMAIKRQALLDGAAAIEVEEAKSSDQAGMYIAYATAPNRVSDDAYEQDADHSPFTRALLNHIATPGYSLQQVMSYVSNDVGELTDWDQTPWTSSSLTTDLRLNGWIAQEDLKARSEAFAMMSIDLAQAGRRGEALAMALKGLPPTWTDDFTDSYAAAKAALYRANQVNEIVLFGHAGPVQTAEFNPDKSLVVTGSTDGTAKVWNANTGALLSTLQGNQSDVLSATFSPNGSLIAIGSSDGLVKVWNSIGYTEVAAFKVSDDPVDQIMFSPDGEMFATVFNKGGEFRIWNTTNWGLTKQIKVSSDAISLLAFSADSRRFASLSWDMRMTIFDAQNWKIERIIDAFQSSTFPRYLAFSGDGNTVITAEYIDPSRRPDILYWDIRTGSYSSSKSEYLKHNQTKNAQRNNNTRIVSRRYPELSVVDTTMNRFIWSYSTEDQTPLSALSKDGNKFAIYDESERMLFVYGVDSGSLLFKRNFQSTVERRRPIHMQFGPDGDRLAIEAMENVITIFSLATNQSIELELGFESTVFEFDPSGNLLAVGGDRGELAIYDVQTGSELSKTRIFPSYDNSMFIVFDDLGERMFVAAEHRATLINTESWGVVEAYEYTHLNIESAAFNSQDGELIKTFRDGSASIWSAEAGQYLRSEKSFDTALLLNDRRRSALGGDLEHSFNTARISAPGKLARSYKSAASDVVAAYRTNEALTLVVRDVGQTFVINSGLGFLSQYQDYRSAQTIHLEEREVVLSSKGMWSVADVANGGSLVAVGNSVGTIFLVDLSKGTDLLPLSNSLTQHNRSVTSTAFSVDGRLLLTSSSDATAKVWDVESGSLLSTLGEHTSRISDAAFSANRRLIGTGSFDYTSKIWDAQTGEVLHTLTKHNESIDAVVFNGSGNLFATASNSVINIWNVESGNLLTSIPHTGKFPPENLVFDCHSPLLLVSDSVAETKIYDYFSREVLDTIEGAFFPFEADCELGGPASSLAMVDDTGTTLVRPGLYGQSLIDESLRMLTIDQRNDVRQSQVRFRK